MSSLKTPRGVSIRTHESGNSTVYISFMYKGVRCREKVEVKATPAGIKHAERLLGKVKLEISNKDFNFSETFPNSKKLKLFSSAPISKTVLDYLNESINSGLARKLSPATINSRKIVIKQLEDIHQVKVADLNQLILKKFFMERTQGLSTCNLMISILRTAIDEAIIDGVITTNPCKGFRVKSYVESKTESSKETDIDPFTHDESDRIINSAYSFSSNHGNMFQFWLHTGLRSSELISLTWGDVDLVNKMVTIKKARVFGIDKVTKTKSSNRTIPLDSYAYDALMSQKSVTFLSGGHIFTYKDKPILDAENIRKGMWARVVRKSGVRYRKPYNCRHTFATMHISRGINIWKISQWLGHTSPNMLFRNYGSYIESYSDDNEHDLINGIIKAPGSTSRKVK